MSKKGKDELDGKSLSRRNLLKAGAAASVSAALGGPAAAGRDDDRHGDERNDGKSDHGGKSRDRELTLVNGRFHTMDDHDSVVSSVTIRNGRFAAVGRGSNSGSIHMSRRSNTTSATSTTRS